MKLAVATLLPDELCIRDGVVCWSMGRWAGGAVMDTEWLHVCELSCDVLTHEEWSRYRWWLWPICAGKTDTDFQKRLLPLRPVIYADPEIPKNSIKNFTWERCAHHPSVEHRLEALCRVKFPELFTQ